MRIEAGETTVHWDGCGYNQEKLYEKYTTQEEIRSFLKGYESLVSWMLYDAGATQFSPEKFGIPRP